MAIVYFFSILVRIPRISGIFGIDGFYLIWEADLLLDGRLFDTMVHPLSWFGMYPFSPYPIGSVISMAFFRILSFKILWLSILLYNMFFVLLATITSYHLFAQFFDDRITRLYTTLAYVTFPFYAQFTYTNVSARAPFLAIYPIFLLSLHWYIQQPHRYNLIKILVLSILSLLFHRMAMVEIGIIISTLFLGLIFHFDTKKRIIEIFTKPRNLGILILTTLVLGYPVTIMANIPYVHYDSLISTNISILNYALIIASQMYQKLGVVVLLAIITVLLQVGKAKEESELSSVYVSFILIQLPLLLLLSNVIYISYLVSILIIMISALTFQEMDQSVYGQIVLGSVLFIVLMSYSFVSISENIMWGHLSLIFILVFLISMLYIGINWLDLSSPYTRIKPHIKSIILITILLYNSIYLLDLSVEYSKYDHKQSPGEISTSEQEKLGKFFKDMEPATIWGYSRLLTARLAVYSDWLQFDDLHGISANLMGYYTPDQIQSSHLKELTKWYETRIYENHYNSTREMHAILLNMTITDFLVRNVITKMNIPYFAAYRGSNISERFPGHWFESPLIQNMIDFTQIVYETSHYVVYDLRPYHLSYSTILN